METHQAVNGGANLGLEVSALALAELDGNVDQALVLGLVDGGEDEGGVGGGVLGLVGIDGYDMGESLEFRCVKANVRAVLTLEVARIGDDDGAGLLEVVEGGRHGRGRGRCVWW